MACRAEALTRDADAAPRAVGEHRDGSRDAGAVSHRRLAALGPYVSSRRLDRIVALAVTLAMFAAQWHRFASFRFATYDLAVFDQVVWKMANGHGATSTLTAWNAFADHLSPILLVFVPLYWLAETPVWFFAAQAIALGGAVLCVRPLAAAVGIDRQSRVATVMVIAYAAQPAIWNGAVNAFHPTVLAVPFLFMGLVAALRQHHRVMWFMLLVLIVLRDDLTIAAAAVAVVDWKGDTKRGRRNRAFLAGAALAWMVLGAQLGEAMGASRHFAVRYGYLGESMTDAALHPVHAGVGALQHLFAATNIGFVLAALLPLAMLPLARPGWALLAAFVALPNLLADDKYLHSPSFHYGAPLIPFLMLAAAGALVAVDLRARQRAAVLLAPMAGFGLLLVGPTATGALSAATSSPSDIRAALATVRPEDRVVASDYFGSYLSQREVLLPLPYPFVPLKNTFPLDPEVRSTAQSKQDQIDVIIGSNFTERARERLAKVAATEEVREEFERTDFGSVSVFRRKA